jgi:hypothetical protein
MKLRNALRERRVRAFGPGGGGVGGCGRRWGRGCQKAPNPQAPSSRETSISNHQTGNSDAWERLTTHKYAYLRLGGSAVVKSTSAVAFRAMADKLADKGVARCCAIEGKVLRELCGLVRVDAAMCGYVRIFEKRGGDGSGACLFLTIFGLREKDLGIIFTGKRVIIWETAISPGNSPYFSRDRLRISRPFQTVGRSRTLATA